MPFARLSYARLFAATAMNGALRVTKTGLILAVGNPGTLRISRVNAVLAVGNPGAQRVSDLRLLKAQSLNRLFYLIRLGSTSTINDFNDDTWSYELVAGRIPEFNPYKPQVPESLIKIDDGGREIFDWLEEQQKTIRLQHNITQAGDTTFPHQLIINSHTDKQFTLGAVGKFYHEDYGLIHARYVQFDKMDRTVSPTAPVGLIKNNGKLDWVVTNRLEISDPYLALGISASYVTPQDKQYGWVTVDGVNLQVLVNDSDDASFHEAFVWSATGKISNSGPGIILARRLNDGTSTTILRGQLYIRLESISEDGLVASLQSWFDIITQLQADMEALQEATDIAAFTAAINQLKIRLSMEENARRAADAALSKRLDNLNPVTAAQLAQAIAQVNNTITAMQLSLTNSINATHAIAVEALDKANQALAMNLGAIEAQLNLILNQLRAEISRVKGKFPVVDGSIPPNLVYLDDGSLVYTETY